MLRCGAEHERSDAHEMRMLLVHIQARQLHRDYQNEHLAILASAHSKWLL